MSSTSAIRSLAGHFAEPQMADLKFKDAYRRFSGAWETSFGWRLLKELQPADQHVLQRLRVPLDESQPEFEGQILGLTKLLVDRLNEKEISKNTKNPIDGAKGIQKLDTWLSEREFPDRERQIANLKRLQELRSKMAAHSKGSDYAKFLKKQGVDSDFAHEMTQELNKATDLLHSFAEHFEVRM